MEADLLEILLNKIRIMNAKLLKLYSVDINQDLSEFYPKEDDNFGFWARMSVGDFQIGGDESFDIFICTPKWLSENYNKTDIIFGRHHLIVFEYNYYNIFSKLQKYVDVLNFENWVEIGERIGRIAYWEFEDYQDGSRTTNR
jgi:hypothetical protein